MSLYRSFGGVVIYLHSVSIYRVTQGMGCGVRMVTGRTLQTPDPHLVATPAEMRSLRASSLYSRFNTRRNLQYRNVSGATFGIMPEPDLINCLQRLLPNFQKCESGQLLCNALKSKPCCCFTPLSGDYKSRSYGLHPWSLGNARIGRWPSGRLRSLDRTILDYRLCAVGPGELDARSPSSR